MFPVLVLAVLIAGCRPSPDENVVLPDEEAGLHLLMEAEPVGALSVSDAVSRLSPGDPIVVRGRIGTMKRPFMKDVAAFVLGDSDLIYCDEVGGKEGCRTPWDACLEDPEKIAANRALIIFVDKQGLALSTNLRSVYGLAGLDPVVVVGTVADESTPGKLIVKAGGFYRRSN